MNSESAPSFKIIVIGDSGTGKTSLIRKYIHGTFKDEYEVTVGVDFSSKTIMVDQQYPVQLQIWDTCGQDIYKSITNNFYRGAAAVFLVYAVDNKDSFYHLSQWLAQFHQKGSQNSFIFLIGTKCDLQAEVEPQEAFSFMKTIKGAFFIETSALNNSKIDELFVKAAQTMYKFYQVSPDFRSLVKPERSSHLPTSNAQQNRFTLDEERQRISFQENKKKKCCS